MRSVLAFVALGLLAACAGQPPEAAPRAAAGAPFVLASAETGVASFLAEDAFMGALTPADLSIRLKRNDGPTAADLRVFYAANVASWNAAERARLDAAFARLWPRLAAIDAWLPDEILVVKVSPQFESGLPHTRGAAISMGARLPPEDAQLDTTLLHETFHVLSRAASPEQRDALYGVIGFQRCASLTLPAADRARLFTNPDAPLVEHAAPVPGDATLYATPLLLADPPAYDPARAGIFDYFEVDIAALRRDASGACTLAEGAIPSDDALTEAIYASAGRNTDYLFHPEEVMADNFAQMMMGRADAPNPEVYARMRAVLGLEE